MSTLIYKKGSYGMKTIICMLCGVFAALAVGLGAQDALDTYSDEWQSAAGAVLGFGGVAVGAFLDWATD